MKKKSVKIVWEPKEGTAGLPLDGSHLCAKATDEDDATIDGTWQYSREDGSPIDIGDMLPPGKYLLNATFNPTNATKYDVKSHSATLCVTNVLVTGRLLNGVSPFAGITVNLEELESGKTFSEDTDGDGKYRFLVRCGHSVQVSFRKKVTLPSPAGCPDSTLMVIGPDSLFLRPNDKVDLPDVKYLGGVTGRITDADKKALPNVSVDTGAKIGVAETDENGEYFIPIDVTGPLLLRFKDYKANGSILTPSPIAANLYIDAGSPTTFVQDVVYSAKGATIDGLISDDERPLASVDVELIVGNNSNLTKTNGLGKFSFTNVPFGKAEILVSRHIEGDGETWDLSDPPRTLDLKRGASLYPVLITYARRRHTLILPLSDPGDIPADDRSAEALNVASGERYPGEKRAGGFVFFVKERGPYEVKVYPNADRQGDPLAEFVEVQ
jgi:hypothetical protein